MTSSCEGTVTGATFAFIQLLNVGVPSASPFSLSHLNHCLARDRSHPLYSGIHTQFTQGRQHPRSSCTRRTTRSHLDCGDSLLACSAPVPCQTHPGPCLKPLGGFPLTLGNIKHSVFCPHIAICIVMSQASQHLPSSPAHCTTRALQFP